MPFLDSLQNGYDTTQVKVITINLGDSWSTINLLVWGYSFLTLRDGTGAVWNAYKQNNVIPLNYVIERNPQIVHGWMEGYNDGTIRQWVIECLVGVEENVSLKVQESKSLKVYPNPFTQKTIIELRIPEFKGSRVQEVVAPFTGAIGIYDLAGRLVREFNRLTNQPFNQIVWDGKDNSGVDVPSGIYFCKLTAGEVKLTKKLTLLKR